MENIKFEELNLSPEILSALNSLGYTDPTPIQNLAIPRLLQGEDLFACAQTGTGKTAAFALPILNELAKSKIEHIPQQFSALVLLPTRELAEQVASNMESYAKYTNLKIRKVYGGVSQRPQVRALQEGVDVVVATPGRLIDLYNQRLISFEGVKYLVLDEADRMLDMGFLPDIKRIIYKLPKERQSMLFSATLFQDIRSLASFIVKDAEFVNVAPDKPTADRIEQKICFVERENKFELLKHIIDLTFKNDADSLILIFTKTKRTASSLAKRLEKAKIQALCIHGDKTQSSRQKALDMFKKRTVKVLAATDIAARGIDVQDMNLVLNYDLPAEAENYIHRIGRTARANMSGVALSFCSPEELWLLRPIEKLIKKQIPLCDVDTNPFHCEKAFKARDKKQANPQSKEELKKNKKNRTFKKDFGSKKDAFGNFKKKRRTPKLVGKNKM